MENGFRRRRVPKCNTAKSLSIIAVNWRCRSQIVDRHHICRQSRLNWEKQSVQRTLESIFYTRYRCQQMKQKERAFHILSTIDELHLLFDIETAKESRHILICTLPWQSTCSNDGALFNIVLQWTREWQWGIESENDPSILPDALLKIRHDEFWFVEVMIYETIRGRRRVCLEDNKNVPSFSIWETISSMCRDWRIQ